MLANRMRWWLLLLCAACAGPRPIPASSAPRLDPVDIEAATGTAGPFLHPVAGHDEPRGIPLIPPDAPSRALEQTGDALPDADTHRGNAAREPPDAQLVRDSPDQ